MENLNNIPFDPDPHRFNLNPRILDSYNILSYCLHEQCEQCNGTGTKKNGQPCIHMISCPCKKCSPYSL